jgi:MYXO-CTERM domain-containing protein
MTSTLLKAVLAAAGIALAAPAFAGPIQLITNGSFETGTFAGWTVNTTNTGNNNFYLINNGAAAPISGAATATNAAGGTWVAVSDQNGSGGEALSQSFTKTAAMSKLTLSFDWFDNAHYTFTGSAIDGSSESGRVDIMKSGAAAFDVGAGVAQNLLLNAGSYTSFGTAIAWQHSTFDLSNLADGSYNLRFGNGQCCSFQEFGVDNVSLVANVPEPGSLALALAGFGALGWHRRRRADKAAAA